MNSPSDENEEPFLNKIQMAIDLCTFISVSLIKSVLRFMPPLPTQPRIQWSRAFTPLLIHNAPHNELQPKSILDDHPLHNTEDLVTQQAILIVAAILAAEFGIILFARNVLGTVDNTSATPEGTAALICAAIVIMASWRAARILQMLSKGTYLYSNLVAYPPLPPWVCDEDTQKLIEDYLELTNTQFNPPPPPTSPP